MKRYFVSTISTYVFEAEDDDKAIDMVENHFGDIEPGIEGESLEMLTIYDGQENDDIELPRIVRDYR